MPWKMTVTDTICIAHRLETFPEGHKCQADVHGHGHNASIEVVLSANELVGGVMLDFGLIKDLWRAWDHHHLNYLPPFRSHPEGELKWDTTAENISKILFGIIADFLAVAAPHVQVVSVKWAETDSTLVEYYE